MLDVFTPVVADATAPESKTGAPVPFMSLPTAVIPMRTLLAATAIVISHANWSTTHVRSTTKKQKLSDPVANVTMFVYPVLMQPGNVNSVVEEMIGVVCGTRPISTHVPGVPPTVHSRKT